MLVLQLVNGFLLHFCNRHVLSMFCLDDGFGRRSQTFIPSHFLVLFLFNHFLHIANAIIRKDGWIIYTLCTIVINSVTYVMQSEVYKWCASLTICSSCLFASAFVDRSNDVNIVLLCIISLTCQFIQDLQLIF